MRNFVYLLKYEIACYGEEQHDSEFHTDVA